MPLQILNIIPIQLGSCLVFSLFFQNKKSEILLMDMLVSSFWLHFAKQYK